jgi:hypothetical protein
MAGIFSKIKNAYTLFQHLDFEKLDVLSKKVDLVKVVDTVSGLNDQQLSGLMKMLAAPQKKRNFRILKVIFIIWVILPLVKKTGLCSLKYGLFLRRK